MTQPTRLLPAQINQSTRAPAAARDAPLAAKAKGIMKVSITRVLFVLPASSRSWLYCTRSLVTCSEQGIKQQEENKESCRTRTARCARLAAGFGANTQNPQVTKTMLKRHYSLKQNSVESSVFNHKGEQKKTFCWSCIVLLLTKC